MNWLKRKLRYWILDDDNKISAECYSYPVPATSGNVGNWANGINLRIYSARGGTVIETNVYDRHKDSHHTNLHVITDDKNLGEELNKIITIENLRA